MSDALKLDGLDKIVKALKIKPPKIQIGILGDKTAREDKEKKTPTNASIGAAHEFGTAKLPQRSFLRVPLIENLNPRLKSSGMTDREVINDVIKSGTVTPWLKKVAVLAESIVLEAFDTSGFGKWKLSDMSHKKNHQTLVETNQLRDSITTRIKE